MAEETTESKKAGSESQSEDELLTQIRQDFHYVKEYWRPSHENAEKDMLIAACIPPSDFTEDRAGRPCIWPDEISQYVKQCCNNLRQNKRSTKISPRSADATDQDAQHRQAYMRGIEYASKAASVRTTAFEAAVQCSMGFYRVTLRVTGPNGEQEPRLARIPNQFSVYLDPDAAESDFSDGNIGFILCPPMRESAFQRRYPRAKKQSFSNADRDAAADWFDGPSIVPAEYWSRKEITLPDGEKRHKVTQRITNGVEILETNEWIGSWIPIIGVFGEELYVKEGGQVKRMFLSLIRRAIAPQQMLAYVASQEAEEFGEAPRAPMLVVEGSVDPDKWKNAHRIPTAYLEYKVPADWNFQSQGPFPPPTRTPFSPNVQAYELAREAWRRAVQSAMGISPLPTAAQRQNDKSGKALERIQTQEAVGSYHFTDNFMRSMDNEGRQINELITVLAERGSLPSQLVGKDQKDNDVKLRTVQLSASGKPMHDGRIIDPAALDPASEHLKEADYFFAHRGQFELTVSEGPNYLSEREEASDFADTIFKTVEGLAQLLPPGSVAKLLALAIKLKNIGHFGDEMADLLAPKDDSGQQLQAAQQQLAQGQQVMAEMKAELDKLKMEKLAKVVDNEYRAQQGDRDREVKLAVAEITAKSQQLSERIELMYDLMQKLHVAAHERGMQAEQHGHEHELADKTAATAALTQASDQTHQQTMAEQTQPEAGVQSE